MPFEVDTATITSGSDRNRVHIKNFFHRLFTGVVRVQFIVAFHLKESFKSEGPPADIAQVEQAEQIQAKALYKCGSIRQIWALQKPEKGAVGLFESGTREELDSMVASFPLVQKEYADYEVFPLAPFGPFAE